MFANTKLVTALKLFRIPSKTRYVSPVCMAISGALLALEGQEVAWSKSGTMHDEVTPIFGVFHRRLPSDCKSEVACVMPRAVIRAEMRFRNLHLRARFKYWLQSRKAH